MLECRVPIILIVQRDVNLVYPLRLFHAEIQLVISETHVIMITFPETADPIHINQIW